MNKKQLKLISVIIPSFNVEKTLPNCLDSVINQTYPNLEILIINDGSTDNTLKIAKKYQKKDRRVRVLSHKNQGYGFSINIGLSSAKGDFVSIVEPDDFIVKDFYSTLIKKDRNDVTCIRGNFYELYPYYKKINGSYANFFKKNKLLIENKIFKPFLIPEFITLQPSIWNGIYKLKYLKDKKIKLIETPGASFQDLSFHLKFLLSNPNIIYIDKPLYYYRIHKNQSVNKPNVSFFIFDIYKDVFKHFSKKGQKQNKIIKKILLKRFVYDFVWNMAIVKDGYKFFIESKNIYNKYFSKLDILYLTEYERSILKSLIKRHYLWYRYGYLFKNIIEGYKNSEELHIHLKIGVKLDLSFTLFLKKAKSIIKSFFNPFN